MQISTRSCPHRVYFYARSRKTRLKSSFANAVRNGIYICEVTFTVLSQRVRQPGQCVAPCYTKRGYERTTLVYIPAHLRFRLPSPETVHRSSVSSSEKRVAFSRVLDSLATLPFRSLASSRGKKKLETF